MTISVFVTGGLQVNTLIVPLNEKQVFVVDPGGDVPLILKYLQDNVQGTMWKARDVAEGLFISSRAVSGAMRKLVSDGYIEKMGQDPVIYSLTEKGKNIKIED